MSAVPAGGRQHVAGVSAAPLPPRRGRNLGTKCLYRPAGTGGAVVLPHARHYIQEGAPEEVAEAITRRFG